MFTDHGVALQPGSLAARVVGSEKTEVKSAHHQGVEELGEGVVVTGPPTTAWSRRSSFPSATFAVGVLWHPEEDERSRVVGSLVDEVRERMKEPA